ncbi:MAG: hypothetical protein ACSHXA_16275 [Polaribacter sp.]|uniref:hypothetical protein n=1 Tax=Polaribacter sp. TaxID=1920175 RepID=UPI003EF31C6B
MAEQIVSLLKLDIDNSQVLKKQGDVLKQVAQLKKENQQLKKSTDGLTKANSDQAQKYAQNEASIKKLSGESRTYKKILEDQIKAQEREQQTVVKTDGSINSLRNALNVNKTTYKNLTKEQRENDQVGGKLLKTIEAQDQEYKDLSKSIGNNQVDVGNYKSAVTDLAGNINIMGVNVGRVVGDLKSKATAMRGVAAATKGTTKGLKLFRIALIATGIGAIVVLLGSLIAAFASTQRGADAISKGLAPIKGAFSAIVGILQNAAIPAFEILKNTFVIFKNTFLAGVKLIQLAWAQLFGTDEEVEKLKGELKGLADESIAAGNAIVENGKKAAGAFAGSGDKISENIKRQKEIVALGIEIEKKENDLIVKKAQLLNQIKEQEAIAKDTTLSAQERNAAVERAKQLSDDLASSEQNILDLKIRQKTLENEQNDTSREDQAELNRLKAERIQKDTEAQARELKFLGTKNSVAKEEEAKRKKAQDDRLKRLKDELKLQETLSKNAIDLLNAELEILKQTNQSKLDDVKVLTQGIVDEEKARLKTIFDEQKRISEESNTLEIQSLQNQLKTKEISQKEFDSRLKVIDAEFKASQLTAQNEFNSEILAVDQALADGKQAIKDQEKQDEEKAKQEAITKAQEEKDRQLIEAETDAERQLLELEFKYQKEIEYANKIGADTTKIEEEYADKQIAIAKAKENAKLAAAQQIAGTLKGLFEENTLAYKVSAIAEASIATYLAATKALATIPPPLNVGVAAATVAAGLVNVSKIAGFAEGSESMSPVGSDYSVSDLTSHTGIISGTPNISRANGDNMLATVKTGEAILNQKQQSKLNSMLGFDAVRYAVKGYADGTTFTSPTVSNSIASNVIRDTASGLVNPVNESVQYVVDVKDIDSNVSSYQTKVEDASI